MKAIIEEKEIKEMFITRINYIELLAGTSENAKTTARRFLQPF